MASWLLAPAPIPEILARQQSVEELRPRLDLREDVALLGNEVDAGGHPEELTSWAVRGPVFTARQTRWLRAAAPMIGLFSAVAVVMWLGFGYRRTAMAALVIEAIFLFLYRAQIGRVIAEDEILSGTNSHDRLIGAEAIVRGLVERGAIGLVTMRDLALTRIAETLNGRSANVHFEDRLGNGRMVSDYKMRPGVVERSNALELMRSVGLEV